MIPAYRIVTCMKYIFNEVAKSMNENLSETEQVSAFSIAYFFS